MRKKIRRLSGSVSESSWQYYQAFKQASPSFNYSKWLDRKIKEDFHQLPNALIRELKYVQREFTNPIVEKLRALGDNKTIEPIAMIEEVRNHKKEKDKKLATKKDESQM